MRSTQQERCVIRDDSVRQMVEHGRQLHETPRTEFLVTKKIVPVMSDFDGVFLLQLDVDEWFRNNEERPESITVESLIYKQNINKFL